MTVMKKMFLLTVPLKQEACHITEGHMGKATAR